MTLQKKIIFIFFVLLFFVFLQRLQKWNHYKPKLNIMKLAKEYLEEFGIKPSIQRIAVMKYLMQHHTHPTVDEIYVELHDFFPTLSKTTIYNTLSLFVEAGVISSINIDEKNLRYDMEKKPHAHFKCKKCHAIIDLPVPNVCHEVFAIADVYKDLEIHEAEISLWGYCKVCKENKNSV